MASYDLKCAGCGREFEVFVQGFLKDAHRVCPDCGSSEVEQRFTGFMMGSMGGSRGTAPAPAGGGCAHAGSFG